MSEAATNVPAGHSFGAPSAADGNKKSSPNLGLTVIIYANKSCLQKLPNNHPPPMQMWCQPILQIQSRESSKKLAARHVIAHHLHLYDTVRNKGTLFIHHHHFSLSGWSHSKHPKQSKAKQSKAKTTLITANTAKKWDA
jgi:hypothetical protein